MLHPLHCPLLSLSSRQVPVHLGRRQRSPVCSTQHQPCTWANRGADSSKSTDGIWIIRTGQWAFQSTIGLNTHKCRVFSSPLLSPPSCLKDRSSPMSSSLPQQWGEDLPLHTTSQSLGQRPCTRRVPREWELMKPAPTAPSHPAAFAAIYSPTTPRGGKRDGDGDQSGVHGTPPEGHGDCRPPPVPPPAPAEPPSAG